MQVIRPPIVDVLQHYGASIVPVSNRYRAMRCPLHDDRNASASVNTDLDRFRCFACDFNGDSFDLIARMEGCPDFNCSIACAEKLFGGSYGGLLREPQGLTGRRIPFQDSPPVRGQRTIFQTRLRRKPLTGA